MSSTKRLLNDGRVKAAVGLGIAEKLGGPFGVLGLAAGVSTRAFWRSRIRHEVLAALALLAVWLWVKAQVGPIAAAVLFLSAGVAAWRFACDQIRDRWRAMKMQARLRQASGYLTNGTGRVRISRTRTCLNGFVSHIQFSHGAHARSLDLKAGAAHLRNVHALRVSRSEHEENRGTLTTLLRDPFADMAKTDPVPWPPLENPVTDAWAPLPFAVNERGETVALTLFENHYALAGLTRRGKTVAMSQVIAWVALDPAARLHVLDYKQADTMPWFDRADSYAAEPEDAIRILRDLNALMRDRREMLVNRRREKIAPREDELHLLAIDELHCFCGRKATIDGVEHSFDELLHKLVSLGASVGIVCVVSTQRPQADIIPTRLRENIPYRIAFGVSNSDSAAMILGEYPQHPDEDPSQIPGEHKGVCIIKADSGEYVKCRTFLITNEQRYELGRLAAERHVVEAHAQAI